MYASKNCVIQLKVICIPFAQNDQYDALKSQKGKYDNLPFMKMRTISRAYSAPGAGVDVSA